MHILAGVKRQRLRGPAAVLAVAAAGVALGMLGIAPVASQALHLQATEVTEEVPIDDPWAAVWDTASVQEVPLSAQNVVAPFGGGAVAALTVRALHDDGQIYLLVEWQDGAADDAVNASDAFSDAVAVQFPSDSGAATPYTMGSVDAPVNIWQWKAVWQTDIDSGFATSKDRYPNTYSDDYPNQDDPTYKTALDVGNPLAQRERTTPIENLVAAGFGTLTTADVQDVVGSGGWRDGRWRALFARDLAGSAEGLATFAVGETTQVAFAVWDGGSGDRNGQKSLAQFIDLSLGEVAAPPAQPPDAGPPPDAALPLGPPSGEGPPWAVIAVIFGAIALVAAAVYLGQGPGREAE
jgi:complex iron-sulfur molybdoenzyme family reductase subunit gamma